MKIMNKLTLRYLQQNKKRTILTILCISVSVIMICCIGISLYSGKQFYKQYIEHTSGYHHYTIVNNHKDIIQFMKNDPEVKEYYFSSTSFYSVDDKKNDVSLNLKQGDDTYFEKENFDDLLIKGRLPNNHKEIAISQKYLINNHIQKNMGDTISLKEDDSEKTETYLIVGLINDYEARSYYKKSFNAISYIDLNDPEIYYTMYVIDKDVSTNIFKHGEKINHEINEMLNQASDFNNIFYNSQYLGIQDIFEENSQSSFLTLYNMVAILLFVIIFISFFIIYQAFNLSTHDRIQYLGMLSSVGATSKQKKRSVYFEGAILSFISIPLGIFISFIGMTVTFFFINQLDAIQIMDVKIHAQISIFYLFIVILLSLLTIFISLYLPARKISKISVIDALKKNDEIKVKKYKLRTSSFSKRFLNISQQLAVKNYKRQGRRSKVIVLSLVISMVAFISIFSFGQKIIKTTNNANHFGLYDIEMITSYEDYENITEFLDKNEKVDDYYFISYPISVQLKIDEDYLYIPRNQQIYNQENDEYEFVMIGLNDSKRKELCEENGIKYDNQQVLIYNGNYTDYEDTNDQTSQYKHRFKKIDNNLFKSPIIYKDIISDENGNPAEEKKIELKELSSFALINQDKYKELYGADGKGSLMMVVPLEYIIQNQLGGHTYFEVYIVSKDHVELTKEMKTLGYSVNDYAQSVLENRQIFLIIEIFIYGFVCIMIFFTMLNIINMMSASIEKRKKEFGMMLSVGMSPQGIHKMIWYESFIYGLKTLLYATPISIFIEWLLYNQIHIEGYSFSISYIAYMISFIVIMFVMILTFRTGLNKFKKQNIIETLKDDM